MKNRFTTACVTTILLALCVSRLPAQEPSENPPPPSEDEPADATTPTNTAPDPKQVYAAALIKFEQDQKTYEADLKSSPTLTHSSVFSPRRVSLIRKKHWR